MRQTANLSWNSTDCWLVFGSRLVQVIIPSQPTENAGHRVILVHVLKSGSRSRFPEIYEFIAPVWPANEHETAATDATMVAANNPNAEDGTDHLSTR